MYLNCVRRSCLSHAHHCLTHANVGGTIQKANNNLSDKGACAKIVGYCTCKEVVDESDGCGAKFSVVIVSDKFQGRPLLARHRLVNSVLNEELKTIHAFTQKTLTVEQWDKQKS